MNSRRTRNLYKGVAWYYARYRPGYPKLLFDYIKKRFRLDGTGRLLDLGCGTGQLTIPLSKNFREVVATDPEIEMLSEGRKFVRAEKISNVKWIRGGSENLKKLSQKIGKFNLVVMGRSFHWMDRLATLRELSDMVVPGGGIAIVSDSRKIWEPETAWQRTVKIVVQRWLGNRRRAGNSFYRNPKERHEKIIKESPFKNMEFWKMEYQDNWTVKRILGYLYSTSFCSLPLLGNKRALFEKDLKSSLLKINPSGKFRQNVSVEAIVAWK